MTQHGFYSVVAYDEANAGGHIGISDRSIDTDKVLVRCRVEEDMEALKRFLPELDYERTDNADYRFRTVVSKAEWARVMGAQVEAIDYVNFKSRVTTTQGRERHDAYMRVWSVMHGLQEARR